MPYSSPIPVAQYPLIAAGMSGVGLLFTAFYFIHQMKAESRNLGVEILLAAASSVALGFGTFFMMLSFGLYV